MKLELHIVNKCGFYARGQETRAFAAFSDTLGHLQAWLTNRPTVASTELAEIDGERLLCADCFGFAPNGWGIKLWHGTPATESGVAYLQTDAMPGADVTASERRLPHNSVPGWPSFFWLGTAAGMDYVGVLRNNGQIRNRGTGLPSLRHYLSSYLSQVSPYAVQAVRAEDENVNRIAGYRATPNERLREDVNARFETSPLQLPGTIDAIRARVSDIRKMVTICKVSRATPDHPTFVERALYAAGWDSYEAPADDTFHFRWETDWKPTIGQFEQLLAEYRQHLHEVGRQERVGVLFTGEGSKVHWFDSAHAEAEVVLPAALEEALDWNRDQLHEAATYAQPYL